MVLKRRAFVDRSWDEEDVENGVGEHSNNHAIGNGSSVPSWQLTHAPEWIEKAV